MIGQRIAHYEILEKLGEGGMGIVYKANDTKLDRLVALKFLPEHVSAGSSDLERFTQEAKAAASLNHPNICTIHGIEEAEGKSFIVMEFVDGQMLQEKKSSLSMKQALDVGIQIAEGLAAAHEHGIVHRDIKPENIMIHKDGRVQIMDFGLAKLRGATRLTKEGSTVGTAGYMSPEQVQGLDVDHRSDLFSLGVLLYEMTAGQSPFKGMHETAISYEIVNVDPPPMSSVRPEVPPELDALALECLEKDPKERAQSASQIAVDLKRFRRTSSRSRMSRTMPAGTMSDEQSPSGLTGRLDEINRGMQYLPWGITGLVVLFALAWALFFQESVVTTVDHLNIAGVSTPTQLIYHSEIPSIALSPDGRMVVFTLSEAGISQLYIRSLDSYEARLLKGTANGTAPFFSPDGQWIGFVADGKIKKIPAAGGAAESLCDVAGFRGASWGPDNRIYVSPILTSGLIAISATDGSTKPFSILDSTKHERTHRWPYVLPGGKWVLYTVGDQTNPNSYTDAVLAIQSIETGERHDLNVRGEMAAYVDPGYLIVGRNGALFAAPFSLSDFQTTEPLSPVLEGVGGDPGSGVLHFSVSSNGNLFYLPGTLSRDFQLVWAARDGKISPLPIPVQPLNAPRLSPDNSRLAYSVGIITGDNDIWIYDVAKETASRLTFTKTVNTPLWSLDGKYLFYASAMPMGIMKQPADGSSQGALVFKSAVPAFPSALANGSKLITSGLGSSDLMVTDLEKETEPRVLISGRPFVFGGSLSPDGKFLTYESTETGRLEIYVCSFPDLKGKWQLSFDGGFGTVWSPKGDEIFYISTLGKMMSVPVKTTPVFSKGSPRELFDASQMSFPNSPVRNFDVSNDAKRFIMVQNTTAYTRESSFNYIQNWIKELEEKVK